VLGDCFIHRLHRWPRIFFFGLLIGCPRISILDASTEGGRQ